MTTPLYVIRSNAKNDLYLSFTNRSYIYEGTVGIAQNTKDFAFYFKSEIDATKFLLDYFRSMGDKIKEQNKKYYKVIPINNEVDLDYNIFMFNVPCYFSKYWFMQWCKNPDKYIIKL
jgi:hypothetical protein